MENYNTKSSNLLVALLVVVAVIFRLIPHPFNFTPVLAVTLFAGAKFKDTRWSILVPVSALLISDVVLSFINNYPLFHNTIFFVYSSYLLIVLLGWRLRNSSENIAKTALYTIISSIIFFIITNLGVWLFGGLYTANITGLQTCFLMALPFLKYSLLGDLFWVATLFGVYEYSIRKFPRLFSSVATQSSSVKH